MSGFYSIDPFYTLNSTGETPAIDDSLSLNVAPSAMAMTGGMMVNQMLALAAAENPPPVQDTSRGSPHTSSNMQSFQNHPHAFSASQGSASQGSGDQGSSSMEQAPASQSLRFPGIGRRLGTLRDDAPDQEKN